MGVVALPFARIRHGTSTYDRTIGRACRAHSSTCNTHKVTPPTHWVTRVTLHSLRDCDNDWAGREPNRHITEKLLATNHFPLAFRFKMTVGALS